ncbi:MAG TPA: peptidase M13, partial [Thermoanaerobaculia bacterium]|nr:peptidase M13 [Thermoanaerobaculia bacterium]
MISRCVSLIAVVSLFTTGAIAADAASTTAAKRYGTWGVDLDAMDRSVKPGDDFFRYVNGKWAATTQIPPDKTSYGAFPILADLSEARVRGILDRWSSADKTLKAGTDEAKVASIYRTFLDEATAEKLDAKPIRHYINAVRKAKTRDDIARLMGRSAGTFGSSFFGAGVSD